LLRPTPMLQSKKSFWFFFFRKRTACLSQP
jgi:hypothetical protein